MGIGWTSQEKGEQTNGQVQLSKNQMVFVPKVACKELSRSVMKSPMDQLFTQTGQML